MEAGEMRRGLLTAIAAICVAAAITAPASATVVRPVISTIEGGETPEGTMRPTAIAVDNSSGTGGRIYASSFLPPNQVVDEFTSAGKYSCQITGAGSSTTSPSECDNAASGVPGGAFGSLLFAGLAVDAAGDVYVGDVANHAVDEFDSAGALVSSIALPDEGESKALAVDPAGEVLIADAHNDVILKWNPSTSVLTRFIHETPSGPLEGTDGVAVDDDPTSPAFGEVYVTDKPADGSNNVLVYDAAGAYRSSLSGPPGAPFQTPPSAIAVDPADGHLFVVAGDSEGGRYIDELEPGGKLVSHTEMPKFAVIPGVAVSAVSGNVYVPLLGQRAIDVLGPNVTVPTVTTGQADGVQPTEAVLHGDVDPAGGGEVTACQFEWGETSSYGNTAACSPGAPYTSPTSVSASVTGLTPDTTYHFRLSATNANGTEHGEDRSFETAGPPTIEEEAATETTQTGATVQAKLNPHGFATTYQVEYGRCAETCPASYEASVPVPAASAGSGLTASTVSQSITGLALDAEYHYRFVATNSQGPTVDGPDQTFTTTPGATVEYQTATAGPNSAAIKATVYPYGENTTCRLQYVTEREFEASAFEGAATAPCTPAEIAGGSGPHAVIVHLAGLTIDTTYHYRFLVSNESGEATGLEGTISTFGIQAFSSEMQTEEGAPFTQAAGHPFVLSTNITFAQTADGNGEFTPSGDVKDVRVQLPPGLVGNPSATATCTRRESEQKRCSGAAQVGTIIVHALEGEIAAPLFNVAPPHGVAAELGARINNFANAFIDAKVRTGGDYGVNAESLNITNLQGIRQVTVKVWGVPGEPGHDGERACPEKSANGYEVPCATPERGPLTPFLTAPGSCTGESLRSVAVADSYQQPGAFVEAHAEAPPLNGCERLHFAPTISVVPETSAADSPTGLEVRVHVPQEENPDGLAEAELKDTTVTLPRGVTVNPAAAGGLSACSQAQIELHGPEPAGCPDSSKIGAVELHTPLFPHRTFKGAVYVAQQGTGNPFGTLLAIYLAIDEPETGVVVKLAGRVDLDPSTGQLTTTFRESPQLPFEDLTIRFFGGPRASLATPASCGSYAATAAFTPWSGGAAVDASSPFGVSSGVGGAACPGSTEPFSPSLRAGTTNTQAGAFSPFTMTMSRDDGNQNLESVQMHLPPGLLGKLASVTPCPEPQAAEGSCDAQSEIGRTTVSVGLGSEPYTVEGGRVFITSGYKGAPYGLSIAQPAKAGPFDLGSGSCDCVVVRAKIDVDRHTSALTVTSDPLPTMLQGIPLQVKRVTVSVDRPGFTFNPTNCAQMAIDATIGGEQGAAASLSEPFQVANCATLPFKPGFTVATQAHTSRADGASLHVKVTSGSGQANIRRVKVSLPRQLPARLSTLQKACLASVFEADPAACPSASVVGRGTAVTPVLKAPLSGPAYLVSHGGAKFPDLEIVLQGEGITLVLDGQTDIKGGITSSDFATVPDAPVTSFELTLPTGPHSALGAYLPAKANGSMCRQRLSLPTLLVGQNGATSKRTTRISVSGCARKAHSKVHRARQRPAGRGTRHRP